MNRRLKVIAFALSLIMVAGVAACDDSETTPTATEDGHTIDGTEGDGGNGELELSDPGQFPIVNQSAELSIATIQSSYFGNVPDLYFTRWYEDKSGISVDWELIPEAASGERISLMMANLDGLPDAIMGADFSTADQVDYGRQGIFLPLQDYIEESGHYLKEAYDDSLMSEITAPDGNVYALAGINECYHCFYSGKAYINQVWLDNLDLTYPETTEEFYDVLKAFKERDPNGNGEMDETPMMGAAEGWNSTVYDFLLNSFVYNDYGSRLALEDGIVSFVADDDEFKEGLKYIRRLIEEDLIDATSLTQTESEYKQVAGDPNEILVGVVTGATWWSGLGNDTEDPLERSKQYVGLSPLEGPGGVRNALTATSGAAIGKFVITRNAEYPELAFRWADGLMSDEATMISSNGEPGVGWDEPEEGIMGINGEPALYVSLEQDSSEGSNVRMDWMPNVALANRTADFRLGQAVLDDEEAQWGSESRLYSITNEYYEPFHSDQAVPSLMYTSDEASERASLQTSIDTFVRTNIVTFLAGNRDIEGEWDSYVAEFENLNLDRFVELTQMAYDRQYGDTD